MCNSRLIDLRLEEFSAALSSNESTPAGGSAAASVGGQGASLAAMVLRLSAAKLAGEERGYLEGCAEEMEDLADCLLELVDRDAQAYRALVRSKGAEQQAALDAPMEIAELSCIALSRLAQQDQRIASQLSADLGVARACLRAAAQGALLVAQANLPGLAGTPAGERAGAALDELQATLSLHEPPASAATTAKEIE